MSSLLSRDTGNDRLRHGERALPDDSARGTIAAGLVVLTVFFAGFGTWAATAPLNGAVIGPAVVKIDGNRKAVAHVQGGTVGAIRVSEGDLVAAGDVLVVLDDQAAFGEYQALSRKQAMLKALEARLLAERDDLPAVHFPPELLLQADQAYVAAAMDGQTSEFDARHAVLSGRRNLLSGRIAQLQSEARGAGAELLSYREQLQSVRAEIDGLSSLADRKLISQQRILQLERMAIDLAGRIGKAEARATGIDEAIAELRNEIAQLAKDRSEAIARDLRDARLQLAEAESRLEASKSIISRLTVRAPYSGRVHGLTLFSVGAVVRPGEPILDIVPTDRSLIVEARIPVSDIADVEPGMATEVRLTSFNQRVVPPVHGRVRSISADRLTDDLTGAPYYAAEVILDRVAADSGVDLYPGMPASITIETHERTALDYIVGPLIDALDRSFRQP